MGEFYYSGLKRRVGQDEVDAAVRKISNELFGDEIRVELDPNVPVGRGDDRRARWLFWDPAMTADCSFTISLLRSGKLEFKVPRSQWDKHWERQQSVRRRLVRHLNAA